MSLRMFSGVRQRVITVLRDFLPAELDLIDAAEGGDATPDVPTNNYHEYDVRPIKAFPAIALRAGSARPIDVRPDTFGQRVQAEYRIDILIHLMLSDAGDNAVTLQRWMDRYAAAVFGVLLLMKEGLQTSADPIRWGSPTASTVVRHVGELVPGPAEDQGTGEVVRTGIVPILVERTEARS